MLRADGFARDSGGCLEGAGKRLRCHRDPHGSPLGYGKLNQQHHREHEYAGGNHVGAFESNVAGMAAFHNRPGVLSGLNG